MAVNINIPSQVKTYANLAAFPATGALKTIYIAEDTNKTYRWTGSIYTEISASAAMTWGAIGGTLSNQTDLQTALNAKQNTLSLTTTGSSGASTLVGDTLNVPNYTLSGLGGVPTSRTLTINGVTQDLSADRTFTISTGITIGSTAIASGTVGRILFEGTGNVVQESSSLFWDATNNRLGIGTSAPVFSMQNQFPFTGSATTRVGLYISDQNIALSGSRTFIAFGRYEDGSGGFTTGISNVFLGNNGFEQGLAFHTATGGVGALSSPSSSEVMRLTNTRNILIGTTTDAGFKLDVNGTARVQNTLTLASTFITASGAQLGVGTSSVNAYYRAGVSGNIGTTGLIVLSSDISGTGTPVYLERTASLFNVFSTLPIAFSVGSERMRIFSSTGNVGINTTTDAGFRLDVNGTARVQGNVTTTSSFVAPSGSSSSYLIGSVNAMDYGDGLRFAYSAGSHKITFFTNGGTPRLQIVDSGSILIGTTTELASSLLTMNSTTRGFLPPRMTTTQKNAIATPAAGLVVYDTTLNKLCVYTTAWETITSL